MNRFDGILRSAWSVLIAGALAFAVVGCEGDTGPAGPAGPAGADGQDGADAIGSQPIDMASVESCDTCHGGVGDGHQALYNPHTVDSVFGLTFDSISSAPGATGGFDFTLNFSITKDGQPYIDPVGLRPSVDSFSAYIVAYDSASGTFPQPLGDFPGLDTSLATSNGDGTYTLTENFAVDPTALAGGAIVGSIADGELPLGDEYCTGVPGGVCLYENVASASAPIGDIATFVSAANVAGCAACHNDPYRKHGNIEAVVTGVPDFVHCKGCHSDDAAGFHPEWQYMVDDPLNWATAALPGADVRAKYAYQRTLMNDVHMSHGMEFPYPMSMSNCATCHANKLGTVLADSNFTGETCMSCHPLTGTGAWPGQDYAQSHRAPPFEYLWQRGPDLTFHSIDADCATCHAAPDNVARTFSEMHSGYDKHIYDVDGNRYATTYTVAIDSITLAGNELTVDFIANNVDIEPTLAISFYGWDTKDFYIASHTRDGTTLCVDHRGDPAGCDFEFEPGSTHPLFTEDAASVAGDWSVTADFAAFVPTTYIEDDIPTLIANGVIKKIEVSILPALAVNSVEVGLEAISQTFDLGTSLVVDDYFKGEKAIVDLDKCEACHDKLGVTFHAGSGRGGDMPICRNCHNPTFDGSHVEMASRSIDNYVHAIHSFQAFDPADVFNGRDESGNRIPDFDPVLAMRYDMHIGHTFPHFTALSCEGCHNKGTYNVPDQSKTIPGAASPSDNPLTWYDIVPTAAGEFPGSIAVERASGRSIGDVPSYIAGPASRACGGCHRADSINADAAGSLASFNAHTESFGTFVEYDDDDDFLYEVIDKIMGFFE